MKISELSKATGVSQRMLRYFEQMGLLDPARTEKDYRKYGQQDVKKILEIREWQRLGLSLKEINQILENPERAYQILDHVFVRERDVFLEKQGALKDLREKFMGKKYPYFQQRIAHPVQGMDVILKTLDAKGWSCSSFEYLRFCEWQDQVQASFCMVGEIIWSSSFYLLIGPNSKSRAILEKLMADFCKCGNQRWPAFDGNPPQEIEIEDVMEFFAPNDVIISLNFSNGSLEDMVLILPYQSLFALAK